MSAKRARLAPLEACIQACLERRRAREGVPVLESRAELVALEDRDEVMSRLVQFWYGGAPLQPRAKEAPIAPELLFSCTLYTCGKCRKKQTRYVEKQTRSSDEPATQFIECICGHQWRR